MTLAAGDRSAGLAPLTIEPTSLPTPTTAEVARRVLRAITIATRRFDAARRRGKLDETAVARALRCIFDDLGGTFSKFGQLIASSPSIFGDGVAHELRGCLDAGPAVPFPDVRDAIESDLGRPLCTVFSSFEPKPMAAASLAVVHRATLVDGTPVAVKVLRPDIARRIGADLAVLRPLCRFAGRQVAVGIAGTLPGLVHGLEVQIAEELDLTNEANALRWFASVLDVIGGGTLRVPSVHAHASGRTVLTMELLDGIPIDDAAAIRELGVDPVPLVRDCIRAWFAATLCTGAFHGDVHAGNLLVRADGTLAVVDWGIVGRLDQSTSTFFRRMLEGVLGDDGAWHDVAAHLLTAYGTGVLSALGVDEARFAEFARAQIEPIFHLPFGQVDLRTMLIGDGSTDGKRAGERTRVEAMRNWWHERRRQRALMQLDGYGGGFDRATFLLSKQLVYFDRYGKLFLPDAPLLDDRDAFRALLEAPALTP